jgi:hypothetical protein
MIDLSIQIKLILFSLIFGILFSMILDILYQFLHNKKKNIYIIISILNILLMSVIYFVGINKIGYGVFHMYSILCVIVGFISYDLIMKKLANKYKK